MGIPENKLTVIAPDVGGGFGSKIYHYGEEALVLAAAKKLGRTVKWTSDRSEAFLTDAHGRDHVTKIELALDAEGNFLAFRTETMANVGAYLSNFSTATPTFLHGTLMAGNYTVPLVYVNVKAVFTNTAPVDAYRGAGRPEATYSLERVIDMAAREIGMDPIELRRKNFIKPDQYPFASAAGLEYDSGNYDALMDRMENVADMAGFAARRAESEAKGMLRGFGVNAYIEACGIAPSNLVGILGSRVGLYDAATVRVNATGNLSVMVGAHSHGQGHETVFPQIVGDMLGIDPQRLTSCTAIRRKSHLEWALTALARSRSVALPWCVRRRRSSTKPPKSRHICWRRAIQRGFHRWQFQRRGHEPSVSFGEVALKAYIPHEFPLEESSRAWKRRHSTIRPTLPTHLAPTAARSKSTQTLAKCALIA